MGHTIVLIESDHDSAGAIARLSFDDAGIPWHECYHEDRGRLVLVLVPEQHTLARLPSGLVHTARDTNPTARLRIAIHAQPGDLTATGVDAAFRLLDDARFVDLADGAVDVAIARLGSSSADVPAAAVIRRRTIPRQLPPGPTHFVGRSAELAAMDKLVTEDAGRSGPMFAVVSGAGGVGKTALALRWLHRNAESFPDGQLFADLSAFGAAGPASPADVLDRFLGGLGVSTADLPPSLAEQTALFRSMTANKAFAILLDDAASAGQVRALLPASSRTMVLVTSRRRLTGLALDDASLIGLDPLGSAGAVELLARVVGRDRVQGASGPAEQLAQLCGGMPIALRVAAARLSSRPRRQVSWLVEQMRDERQRLGELAVADDGVSVAASLDLSYRDLSPEAARLYRLLSAHPGAAFGSGAAGACLGCSAADAAQVLEQLVEASMLADLGENRYRFHDLLRVHAARLAAPQERLGAVRAMVLWYLDRAVEADIAVTPLRPHYGPRYQMAGQACATAGEGLDWLDAELPNLRMVVRVAHERGWHDLVWQLCEALWGLFLYRGHYRDWIDANELGVDSAAQCDDPVAESRILVQLAAAHHRLGQPVRAARYSSAALARAQAAGHWASEATALEALGNVAHSQGQLNDALDHYRRSTALSELHGQTRGVVLLLCYQGYVLRDQSRPDDALEHFRRAAELAVAIDDHPLLAQALVGTGAAYAADGRFALAIAEMSKGLALLDRPTAPALFVQVLHQLGETCRRAGDLSAAREHWSRALDMYAEQEDPRADELRVQLNALAADTQVEWHPKGGAVTSHGVTPEPDGRND